MGWLRWEETSTACTKFAVVARKSGQNVASVIAVWAMLLERASAANNRGDIEGFDCEGADIVLGLDDGASCAIMEAMMAKGMIDDRSVCKWEDYQVKREDNGSETAMSNTERGKLHRANKKLAEMDEEIKSLRNALQQKEAKENAAQREETHGNETKRTETLHYSTVEREEEKTLTSFESLSPTPAGDEPAPTPDGQDVLCAHRQESAEAGAQRYAPECPLAEIVGLYHDALPEHPAVKVFSEARRRTARARWKTIGERLRGQGVEDSKPARISWLKKFFARAARSDFLTGKIHSRDKPAFIADFDFLFSPKGFTGVIEGKYDNREAA